MTVRKAKPAHAPPPVRVHMTPGTMLATVRELQELSQTELARAVGMPQSAISAIESGRVTLGAGRAARLAVALKVHPSVLLWPNGWEVDRKAWEGGRRSA